MTNLLVKEVEEFRYRVVYDNDYLDTVDSYELCKAISENDASCFGVIKEKCCSCCGEWHHIDSLWGIVEENDDEALKFYLEYHN